MRKIRMSMVICLIAIFLSPAAMAADSPENPPQEATKRSLEERITALEKKADDGWLPSLKGKRVKIGGELRIEYRETETENNHPAGSTDIPYGQFQIDEFKLNAEARLADDFTVFSQIKTNPDSTKLEEAYATLSNFPLNSYLRIGLQKRFIRPDRRAETYPFAGTAFWRERDMGVELGGELKPLYYRLSYLNGLKLDTKQIGEDSSFKIIYDAASNRDWNDAKQVGIGLGLKGDFFETHGINLLLFHYFSNLGGSDISFLKTNLPNYTSNDDTSTRTGVNLEYKFMGLCFFSQYIYAKDGDMGREAWYVQPSYKFNLADLNYKYLYAIEPLYRYDNLNVSRAPVVSKSLTWDRTRHTFAVLAEIVKDAKMKLEYNVNYENTGGQEVKNNEFVAQLELVF